MNESCLMERWSLISYCATLLKIALNPSPESLAALLRDPLETEQDARAPARLPGQRSQGGTAQGRACFCPAQGSRIGVGATGLLGGRGNSREGDGQPNTDGVDQEQGAARAPAHSRHKLHERAAQGSAASRGGRGAGDERSRTAVCVSYYTPGAAECCARFARRAFQRYARSGACSPTRSYARNAACSGAPE